MPGSVNLYYGSELGQTGGIDPANRAPMRWDWVNEHNPVLAGIRQLIDIRQRHRALRVGDLRWLVTERLIGFERYTDRVAEAVVVLANPSSEYVHETLLLPDSKLMDRWGLVDLLTGEHHQNYRATLTVELAPGQVMMLSPNTEAYRGYTAYKRVQ